MSPAVETEPSHFALMFSYSGSFLLAAEAAIKELTFDFKDKRVTLKPPIRLANSCWRPIPLLDEVSAKRVFGNPLEELPLQAVAVPAIGADGTSAMTLKAGRGTEFEPTAPPDTLLFIVHETDENYPTDDLQAEVIDPFLQMLRVTTKQWWIGRNIEKQTGNLHFTFQITGTNQLGQFFAPVCTQTAPDAAMHLITRKIWEDCLHRVLTGQLPPWDQTILADIEYYKSNKEYLTSMLLICGWTEVERDLVLEHRGIKLSALNVSSTDLLKQLSVGFGSALGANLQVDLPREFELLRTFWRSRGGFAHGKPFEWEFEGIQNLRDFRELPALLNNIREWFGSLREPV